MPFNIVEFRSSFKKEPQKPSHFECILVPPPSILPVMAVTNLTNFQFRCSRAQLPGRDINTLSFPDSNYGPILKIANGSLFPDIMLEIIMTQDALERTLFGAWLDFIQPLSLFSTDIRYYDSYSGSLIINCYDSEGNINHIVQLQNCFPVGMSGIDLAWDATNQYATFRVAIAYERYQMVSPTSIPGGLATTALLPEIDITGLSTASAAASAIVGAEVASAVASQAINNAQNLISNPLGALKPPLLP